LPNWLPTVYGYREHVVAGGLISYGVDLRWCDRRAAYFVDKILRGTPPGELPVKFPTKMMLSINLKTAKELGITVPPSLLGSRRRGDRLEPKCLLVAQKGHSRACYCDPVHRSGSRSY
jgi:ABC transporter substrate binding protein